MGAITATTAVPGRRGFAPVEWVVKTVRQPSDGAHVEEQFARELPHIVRDLWGQEDVL